MTGVDVGDVGQLTEHAQALDKHEHRAAGEVGAPDAVMEERIAGEGYVLLLTIEYHSARRVPRTLNDVEPMPAEADDLAIIEIAAHRRNVVGSYRKAANGRSLDGKVAHERFVEAVELYMQPPGVGHKLVANVVVGMSVCSDEAYGLEVIRRNILFDGLFLVVVKGRAIDDDSLAGLVTNYKAVGLEHVAGKTLDVEHGQKMG